jgi:hypothetical protein
MSMAVITRGGNDGSPEAHFAQALTPHCKAIVTVCPVFVSLVGLEGCSSGCRLWLTCRRRSGKKCAQETLEEIQASFRQDSEKLSAQNKPMYGYRDLLPKRLPDANRPFHSWWNVSESTSASKWVI